MSTIPRIAAIAVTGALLLPGAAFGQVGEELDIASPGPQFIVRDPADDQLDIADNGAVMTVTPDPPNDQLDIADNGPVMTVTPDGDPGDMVDGDISMVVGQESSVWDLP